MKEKFKDIFLEEAAEFLDQIDEKASEKVIYNIRKAQVTNDKELFKKLTDEVWEFRTLYNKTYYRLFAFWDKSGMSETFVVSTHGIIKKAGKISKGELKKAERLMKLYYEQKQKKK